MSEEKTKILCIDDDEQIRFALSTLFKVQGWDTFLAGTVTGGVTLFDDVRPDLVLVDYHMPGESGIEAVRQIRELDENVPILVFTIEESQEVCDAFFQAGASDFALKPVKAPDILSRVRLHLQLSHARGDVKSPTAEKGMSSTTMNLVREFLAGCTEPVTVNVIAEGTGLAYPTTYRYLQCLARDGKVELQNDYGKVGRPKQRYSLKKEN